MNMSIRENIQQVRENIAAAALSAGRRPEDITLVGASKMNDAAACREAIAAGIDALGENRVQEMTQKLAENAYDGAPLHFIGHLQRNKVKQVVGKVALIESVGSYELLEDIDRQAEKLGIVQPILLEVNVGGEEAKSGFAVSEVRAAVERAKSLSHVVLRGLHTYYLFSRAATRASKAESLLSMADIFSLSEILISPCCEDVARGNSTSCETVLFS